MGADQSDGREHVLTLTERGIYRVNVFPFRIGWVQTRFQLSRGRNTNDLVRKIDACPFVKIELFYHFLDAFELHLESETIEIAIAGFHDRNVHVGHAVIATHAACELVADRDASTAHQIRMLDGDSPLL